MIFANFGTDCHNKCSKQGVSAFYSWISASCSSLMEVLTRYPLDSFILCSAMNAVIVSLRKFVFNSWKHHDFWAFNIVLWMESWSLHQGSNSKCFIHMSSWMAITCLLSGTSSFNCKSFIWNLVPYLFYSQESNDSTLIQHLAEKIHCQPCEEKIQIRFHYKIDNYIK